MRKVITKTKILKAARLMPIKEQILFARLVKDLAEKRTRIAALAEL